MKLQTATRLGLYAALELARDPAQTRSAADLAAALEVSPNHLAKVLQTLARARLIRAERGAGGGYRFVASPKRTTLMDIVALFEPPPAERPPEPGEHTPLGRALAGTLSEIDEIAEATLRSISLETMLLHYATLRP